MFLETRMWKKIRLHHVESAGRQAWVLQCVVLQSPLGLSVRWDLWLGRVGGDG